MKIAICTDAYLPQLSGVADSIELLASSLRQRGHVVRIYAPGIAGAAADNAVKRLPSYGIPGSAGSMQLVFPFGGLSDLRTFNPDIIHAHTFAAVGLLASFASWRLGVPLVVTDHTSPADYLHYVHLDSAPVRYAVRKFASWFHGKASAVSSPSGHILRELAAYGMRGGHTEVISNPVHLEVFRPHADQAALKKKYGIAPKAVLLFGRIAKEKNLDFALEVFAEVRKKEDAQLVVLGDGPYCPALKKAVARAGLSAHVTFLGVLRGESLVEVLNATDVLLVTSLSEIQPMATLQAMACGLPVVAARAGGLPECVKDGATGFLVDVADKAEFAKKISQLLSNTSLAEQFGKVGRRVVEQYRPDEVAERFEQFYLRAKSPQSVT